jgi:hypothetical protein
MHCVRSLCVVAALLASAKLAAADCAVVGLMPKVANDAAKLPDDGGIVVVAASIADGKLAPGDVTKHADWRIRAGGTLVTPTIETLAPGLSVYRVTTGDKLQLEDDGAVLGKATRSNDKRDRLAAPAIKKLVYDGHFGMHRSENVTAALAGAPPATAIAIVIADASGKARSFGMLEAGKPVLPLLSYDCVPLPNGTVVSKRGDRVKLFWVDDAGRLSAPSAVVTIQ